MKQPKKRKIYLIYEEVLEKLYQLGVDDGNAISTNIANNSNFKIIGKEEAIRKVLLSKKYTFK